MAPPLQRAGSRGFLQTVLRVRTLIIGLFLCCVALMLFQTKLVTVTEELNSRLRREVATLSRTLAAPAGSEGCVDGPEPAVPPAADAARLRPRVSKLMREPRGRHEHPRAPPWRRPDSCFQSSSDAQLTSSSQRSLSWPK